MPLAWLSLVLLLCAAPAGARADVYRWVDEQGRVHMTDDLSQVPPAQRRAAARQAPAERASRGWNAYGSSPASGAAAKPVEKPSGGQEPRRHTLQVERVGSEMRVVARLDGLAVPFVVDTGAMLNTLPLWAAQRLGMRFDERTPVTVLRGVSGEPMLAPLVRIRSVSLAGAVVEDVEMAVLDTMPIGLLGMPFFNHFRLQTDPLAGVLILEEIDLEGVEGVHGGMGEDYWRNRFAWLRHQRDAVRRAREEVPSTHVTIHERIDRAERYWEAQLDELELRASREGVPRAWRSE